MKALDPLKDPRLAGLSPAAALLVPLLLVVAGGAWGTACTGVDDASGNPEGAAHSYPAGTVLAIDGHPILAEDVERFAPMIAMIEPQFVHRDHLRKVLSNISIPTAAGAALLPDERDAAFQRAQALLSIARETGQLPADAPPANVLTGPWRDVGMVSWFEAMNMEPGTFSALHETPGAWTFIELLAADAPAGGFNALTEITVRRYDVPYLPDDGMRELIQDAMDTLPIEVVDPEWEALVPPLFLYKPKPSSEPR